MTVGSVVPSVGVTVVSDGCVTVGSVGVGSVGTVVSSDGVVVLSELSIAGATATAGISVVTGTFSSAKAVSELAEANTATE